MAICLWAVLLSLRTAGQRLHNGSAWSERAPYSFSYLPKLASTQEVAVEKERESPSESVFPIR